MTSVKHDAKDVILFNCPEDRLEVMQGWGDAVKLKYWMVVPLTLP